MGDVKVKGTIRVIDSGFEKTRSNARFGYTKGIDCSGRKERIECGGNHHDGTSCIMTEVAVAVPLAGSKFVYTTGTPSHPRKTSANDHTMQQTTQDIQSRQKKQEKVPTRVEPHFRIILNDGKGFPHSISFEIETIMTIPWLKYPKKSVVM